MLTLLESQYRALDMAANNSRLIFEGGAGTGKTLLAVEMARRSAEQDRHVLFTCRSALVLAQVKRGLDQPGVDVIPFDRIPLDAREQYDQVVVDEAQDVVTEGFVDMLESRINGGWEDGRWALFADFNNQQGFENDVGPSERDRVQALGKPAMIRLNDNCRNTRQILSATQAATGADLGVSVAGSGPEVEFFVAKSHQSALERLKAVLDRLEQEGVDAGNTLLISTQPLERSLFAGLPAQYMARIDQISEKSLTEGRLSRYLFGSTRDVKGLESRCAVLVDIGFETPGTIPHLYVGMSRARAVLFVIADHAEQSQR